jgi:hypothetical protein
MRRDVLAKLIFLYIVGAKKKLPALVIYPSLSIGLETKLTRYGTAIEVATDTEDVSPGHREVKTWPDPTLFGSLVGMYITSRTKFLWAKLLAKILRDHWRFYLVFD